MPGWVRGCCEATVVAAQRARSGPVPWERQRAGAGLRSARGTAALVIEEGRRIGAPPALGGRQEGAVVDLGRLFGRP